MKVSKEQKQALYKQLMGATSCKYQVLGLERTLDLIVEIARRTGDKELEENCVAGRSGFIRAVNRVSTMSKQYDETEVE